jgi:hypothetical protein
MLEILDTVVNDQENRITDLKLNIERCNELLADAYKQRDEAAKLATEYRTMMKDGIHGSCLAAIEYVLSRYIDGDQ